MHDIRRLAFGARDAEDYRDPESCDYNYAFTKDADGHEVEIVTR